MCTSTQEFENEAVSLFVTKLIVGARENCFSSVTFYKVVVSNRGPHVGLNHSNAFPVPSV